MGMKLVTPLRDIKIPIDKSIIQYKKECLDRLVLLGEECYNIARTHQRYMNQLGNLFGSTGYIVGDNGLEYARGGFQEPTISAYLMGSPSAAYYGIYHKPGEGVIIGPELATNILSTYPNSMVMIFVAGMEYASEVEALGKNVITSSEIWAQRNAERIINQVL